MYSIKLLDHFEHPRLAGKFSKQDEEVAMKEGKIIATAISGAAACGDLLKLQIKVDKNDVIEDVRWLTFGCGSAISSSSFLAETIKGMNLEKAEKLENSYIAEELNLPPVKIHILNTVALHSDMY